MKQFKKRKLDDARNGYSLQRNILSSVQPRVIEVNYPIFLYGSGNSYTSDYAATYSFQIGDLDLQLNNFTMPCANLRDTITPDAIGRSREFLKMQDIFTHFRITAVSYTFIRTVVDTGGIVNLPPLALGLIAIVPTAYTFDLGTYTWSRLNYLTDGSSYYQPVNTIKDVEWTTKSLPSIGLNTLDYTETTTTRPNDWMACSQIGNVGLALSLGQALPAIVTSSSTGYLREIGHASIRLHLEFAIPQLTS